jgi:peptidoglycan hydrolase-like protein with peptidoglycan-binding domain
MLGAAVIALAAVWPTIGTTAPKTKAAPATPAAAQPPKPPAPGTPRAVYAAMSEHERMSIQADLIWTGDYNGIVDTDFGDNSVAAVKAFQKRNGGRETGLLNPDERAKLSESARAKRENAGWRMLDDRATGARVGVPASSSRTGPNAARAGVLARRVQSRPSGSPFGSFARCSSDEEEAGNRRPEYKAFLRRVSGAGRREAFTSAARSRATRCAA